MKRERWGGGWHMREKRQVHKNKTLFTSNYWTRQQQPSCRGKYELCPRQTVALSYVKQRKNKGNASDINVSAWQDGMRCSLCQKCQAAYFTAKFARLLTPCGRSRHRKMSLLYKQSVRHQNHLKAAFCCGRKKATDLHLLCHCCAIVDGVHDDLCCFSSVFLTT